MREAVVISHSVTPPGRAATLLIAKHGEAIAHRQALRELALARTVLRCPCCQAFPARPPRRCQDSISFTQTTAYQDQPGRPDDLQPDRRSRPRHDPDSLPALGSDKGRYLPPGSAATVRPSSQRSSST